MPKKLFYKNILVIVQRCATSVIYLHKLLRTFTEKNFLENIF